MKNTLVVVALVLTFTALQSCKKEKSWWTKVQESNSGVITAKLNGKDWRGQIVTGYYNSGQQFGISISQYTGDVETEHLSINDIYFTKPINRAYDYFTLNGKKDSTMAYYFLVDDDVILSSYLVSGDSGETNTIYVDNYDTPTGLVNGRFHFTLYLKEGDVAVRNWPDTLKFTDGKFRLKIKNQ